MNRPNLSLSSGNLSRWRRIIHGILAIGLALLYFGFGSPVRQSASSAPNFTLWYLPIVRNTYQDSTQDYLNQFDMSRLTSVTQYLVRQYGPRHHYYQRPYLDDRCTPDPNVYYYNNNLIASLKYAKDTFTNMGYLVVKENIASYLDYKGTTLVYNVIAYKTGSVYPNNFIEVSAHIDGHTNTPGASDNAGSVAAVIEMARLLKNYPNRYSWRFITFVGEEYGLVGSRHHARQVVKNGEQVRAGLVMDGTGWSELGSQNMNCLWDNGDQATRSLSLLFDEVRQQYGIDIAWRLCSPNNQWSDNVAYWEQGFPAVLSIGGMPYADPNYHKCGDTMSSIDMQNVYKTALENLAVLLRLDADDTLFNDQLAPQLTPQVIPGQSH